MKTVTIPTNPDPFKIDINGVRYEYRGGETVEVPDEVADLIENNIANEPKEDPYANLWAEIDKLKAEIARLDTALDGKLSLSGGKMTGDINMNGNMLLGVYYMMMIKKGNDNPGIKSGSYPVAPIKIEDVAEPTKDSGVATKKYVDDAIDNL